MAVEQARAEVRKWQGLLLSALCLCAEPASALVIEHVETQYAHARYQLDLVVTVNAPAARVHEVLRDYAAYPSLDSRILEARVVEHREPGAVVIYTRLRACFGWFCRNVKRTELVTEQGDTMIATVIPESSDVSYGDTRTEVTTDGALTRIRYRTVLSPNFWIPPVIGRHLMLNTLREATVNVFEHVEQRAQLPIEPASTPAH